MRETDESDRIRRDRLGQGEPGGVKETRARQTAQVSQMGKYGVQLAAFSEAELKGKRVARSSGYGRSVKRFTMSVNGLGGGRDYVAFLLRGGWVGGREGGRSGR